MFTFRNFVIFPILILTLSFAACSGAEPVPAEAPSKISILLLEQAVDIPSKDVNVVVQHLTLSPGSDTQLQGPSSFYVIKGQAEISGGGNKQPLAADEAAWGSSSVATVKNLGDGPLEVIAAQVLPAGPNARDAGQPQTATKLFEKVAALPDARVNIVVRHVTLPVGFITPGHTHKGPGPRYILKGQVEIIEGGETQTVPAGKVYWESGVVMTAENISEIPMELIAFQLLPIE